MTTMAIRTGAQSELEQAAAPLRPVAHWQVRTTESGRRTLEMVWRVPEIDWR